MFLAWGAALKSLTAISLTLAAIASLFLAATAKTEELENIDRFGNE